MASHFANVVSHAAAWFRSLTRGRSAVGLFPLGTVLLAGTLGFTLYAAHSLGQADDRRRQSQFEVLASESEQALNARLAAYLSAARSGAGIFQSSDFVSADEWHTFIEALRLRDDYPGLLGLGWIEQDALRYLEPDAVHGLPVGLPLEQRPELLAAAARAADEGVAILSQRLDFGFDDEKSPGFALLQPVYRPDASLESVAERRAALRGLVIAPFVARGLFADLTPSQGRRLDVTLYDGARPPVFSTRLDRPDSRFEVTRQLRLFGLDWRLHWRSTLEFERSESFGGAQFVLIGGLLFTGLFALGMLLLRAHRQPSPELPRNQQWLLPFAAFVLVTGLSIATWALLTSAERKNVSSQVEGELRRVESEVSRAVRSRLQSIRRMAHRWSAGGGTPYAVWRGDARDMVRQIEGLQQLQWIGADYNTHWSEGSRRRAAAGIADLRARPDFARALEESAQRGQLFVTEPREFERGDSVFDVFVPVTRAGRFDGFLSATYLTRGFFGDALGTAAGKSFAFTVSYKGRVYFDDEESPATGVDWRREGSFKMHDREWTFTVSPTQRFVDEQRTPLPLIVLVAGSLVAVLSALLVRYVLVARIEARRLQISSRALRESEERYELALKGMSVGLWDWDIGSNAMFLSQRCREILRIANPDLAPSYKGFIERLHPDDRPRVERMLAEHLKGQQAFDIEFRIRRDDGEYVSVHSYGEARFDDGFAVRMAGSLQDISARTRQARELALAQEKLRLLVDHTPAAIAMFDTEMRYVMASRRWIEDYGLQGRDLIGQSHYAIFPEISAMPAWLDAHRRALRGESFESREDSWLRADGRREWMHWALHPWKNAEGEIGGIVMFTEVITARKLAEEALRSTEAINRAAVDKAPIGKALVSADGRFSKVNLALCQMLGYSEPELLITNLRALTHEDDLAAYEAELRALLEGRIVTLQGEWRYVHRDGRVIWSSVSVSAVRDAGGAVECLMAQLQDVTERKTLERTQSEFLSMVSDELSAPLASLREILRVIGTQQHLLPPALGELFQRGQQHCDRLAMLTGEIADVSDVTRGDLRLDFKDEDLGEITRRSVAVSDAHRRVVVDFDPGLMVFVDAARYAQLLSNLLSNAARFSPADSRIEVTGELRGDWVRVSVRDQGEGIPEELRSRIFGRFARADSPSGRFKCGAGLGLHVARQLVEQMRGRIGFSSHRGEATTFWVEFPHVSRSDARLSA